MNVDQLGFDLAFEGQPLPDENAALALGIPLERYSELYMGYYAGEGVVKQMMQESRNQITVLPSSLEVGAKEGLDMKIKPDYRISIEEVAQNPHLTWSYNQERQREKGKRIVMVSLLVLLASILFLASGCAATQRNGGLGVAFKDEAVGLRGHMMTTEHGKFGWFGAVQAGGSGPSASDEFGEDTGPFVPGPGSSSVSERGSSAMFVGGQGGVTYRHRNVAVLAGLTLAGEQAFTDYNYDTPFSGSGKFFTESDVETRVGAYIGLEFFVPEQGGSIGVGYDTATETTSIQIGFDF